MQIRELFFQILREKLKRIALREAAREEELLDFKGLAHVIKESLQESITEAIERQKEAIFSSYITSLAHLAAHTIKNTVRNNPAKLDDTEINAAIRVALDDFWKEIKHHFGGFMRGNEKEVKAKFIEKVMELIKEV